MEGNIDLLLNIKEIQSICWKEEFITDARTTTEPVQTSTRSSRPQVSLLHNAHRTVNLNCYFLGGKLTIHYLKRSAGKTVAGIPKLRSPALARLTVTKRRVARAYGGKLTHAEVRDK